MESDKSAQTSLENTPAEAVQKLGTIQNFEFFFYSGNRLLVTIEKFAIVFGFFLLVFLVLYPMAHRFEWFSAIAEKLAGEEEGIRKTCRIRCSGILSKKGIV